MLAALREHGVKIGFVSNGSRDLEEFVTHHGLDADCAIGFRDFGAPSRTPRSSAALALLDVEPEEAAMIGDLYEDDIEGARALGMKAFLLDRDGRRPDEPDRLPDLFLAPGRADWRPGRRGRSRTIRTCAASARAAWRRSR